MRPQPRLVNPTGVCWWRSPTCVWSELRTSQGSFSLGCQPALVLKDGYVTVCNSKLRCGVRENMYVGIFLTSKPQALAMGGGLWISARAAATILVLGGPPTLRLGRSAFKPTSASGSTCATTSARLPNPTSWQTAFVGRGSGNSGLHDRDFR